MGIKLVTGGAGFIGSNLVRALIERGHRVRVYDNFSTGNMQNLNGIERKLLEVINADVRDVDPLRQAMTDVDVVFHEAALPSVPRSMKDPLLTTEVNVTGTLNVLEAARQAGVRRVVFASSSSVYGDSPGPRRREEMPLSPMSPYALSKLVGENYCALYARVFGVETVALRYFNVFGPHQDPASQYAAVVPRFISALISGGAPVIFGDGLQSRDFTFVENVVQANLLAAEADGVSGKVFNVGFGQSRSVNELCSMLAELLQVDARPSYEPARPGDVRDSEADITRAREQLGYRPEVGVKEGLKRTVSWFHAGGELFRLDDRTAAA